MDIELLLREVDPSAPAGRDLSNDPEVEALFRDAKGTEERQMGDKVVPAKDPDWSDIQRRSSEALGRSKDIRTAILWTRASIRLSGIVGLNEGLKLIRGTLERYWEKCYPQLDSDDNNDPTFRMNALGEASDVNGMLRDLRTVTLFRTADTAMEFKDLLTAFGVLPNANARAPDPSQIVAELRKHAEGAAAAPLSASDSAVSEFTGLREFLKAKVGEERLPNWSELEKYIAALGKAVSQALAKETRKLGGENVEGPEDRRVIGPIASREDAARVLESVCEFLERAEPAHPAPLLIRRAQRLLRKNFLEIVEDLTPGSVSDVRKLGGLEDK